VFRDRSDAGRQLGELLAGGHDDAVVLGLPRGGVQVACEVARALHAPLDVIAVRKLGVPAQPELAMGAVGEGGVRVLDTDTVELAGVSRSELEAVEAREREEMERRATVLRAGRARLPLQGRTAIVVDDGIATGSTARAACQAAREHGAARVVLAAPVGPGDAWFGDVADEVVVLELPRWLSSIGEAYENFEQLSDEAVIDLLDRAGGRDGDGDGEPPQSAG